MKENLINNSIKNFSEISFREERKGITLIALVITIIVPYDKNTKRFNIKGFLHFGYIKRWVKSLSFFNS